MRNEEEKAKIELRVFLEFASAAKIEFDSSTVRKGDATKREPDIYCEIEGMPVYFELAEACAPEFAAAITKSIKTGEPEATWGSDVSVQTLQNKLEKAYDVSGPIELLLYTAGRTVLPNDVIVAQLEPEFITGLGPFRRVWLFGDRAQCIASNS